MLEAQSSKLEPCRFSPDLPMSIWCRRIPAVCARLSLVCKSLRISLYALTVVLREPPRSTREIITIHFAPVVLSWRSDLLKSCQATGCGPFHNFQPEMHDAVDESRWEPSQSYMLGIGQCAFERSRRDVLTPGHNHSLTSPCLRLE